MNKLTASITVMPLYNQVVVQDPGTDSAPQWETGEEHAVVATDHAVAISTRPDHEGDVEITVLAGNDPTDLGELIFDGQLSVTSPEIEVGSPLGADTMLVASPGPAGYETFEILLATELSLRHSRTRPFSSTVVEEATAVLGAATGHVMGLSEEVGLSKPARTPRGPVLFVDYCDSEDDLRRALSRLKDALEALGVEGRLRPFRTRIRRWMIRWRSSTTSPRR